MARHDLKNPTGQETTGVHRGEAFAHPGVWAGVSVFPGGAATGWHHHGGYATSAYITAGGMRVEYGPGGRDHVDVGAGDFVFIPAHLVHRESVVVEGGEGVVLRVGGQGAVVINVDGRTRTSTRSLQRQTVATATAPDSPSARYRRRSDASHGSARTIAAREAAT